MTNAEQATKSQQRSALAFGFASPILGLTLALLIGMAANDLFGTLQVWVGVIIVALIGSSIVLGGHYSAHALNDEGTAKAPARSAAVLNLVVLSVWSFITLIFSITGGVGALMRLQTWNNNSSRSYIRSLNADDFWNNLLPPVVMLLVLLTVVYLFIVLRSKGRKA